jgi:digeranylgeranylglycerophospholipid reductase
MYDVVIAGGGPAGLCAAIAAAREGMGVAVLEREAAFGIPTRTSGGTFLADMRALGVPERLLNPITTVRFAGPTTATGVHLDPPVVGVLDVRGLYQWLAERAAEAGAELHLRATVAGMQVDRDGVALTVRGHGGEWRAVGRYAVDATGVAAVLARPARPGFERRGVGAELDVAAPNAPLDTCWLVMGSAVAPSGYGWVFPYREGRVRVGVGVIQPDAAADPRDHLERLMALPELREALAGAQPVEMHAGLIPAEPLRPALVGPRLVAVGDASAQASTLVGEGIRFAMRAGSGAGRAVAESVRRGDDAPLRAFDHAWRGRFGRDFGIAYRLSVSMARFADPSWDRAVRAIGVMPPWFVAEALSTRFRARSLLRVAARHPGVTRRLLRAARS